MSGITDIVNQISKATIKQVTPVPSPGPLWTSAAPSSQVPSTPGQPGIPVDFEDKPWFGDQAYIKNNHSAGIPLRYQVSNGRNYKNYILDSSGKEIRLKNDDVVTIYPAWFLVETSDGQRGYIRSKYIHYI